MEIKLEALTMKFGDVTAVNDLSTTIHDGELVSLLGPSGCGKSTTLMMLSGLFKPTSGRLFFDGKDVTNIEAEKREIGMVFQNYALYPHLSILKNIMFPLKMQKIHKKEAKKRATEMAELVKIGHLLDRKPGQLSGGQQQRVAIARALVKKPGLLLLDEPLSNLDASLRLEMREEIRRIQQEVGITAVFVTHDQEEALSISDRVMLLSDGVLQQESEPQIMYKHPINQFAATFLGNPPINLLNMEKSKEIDSFVLEGSNAPLPIPPLDIGSHDAIQIGLRPENLHISDDTDAFINGEISHIETIGRDVLVRVNVDDRHSLRALVNPELTLEIGETCHLGIKQDDIHYFATATGERIKPL